MKLTQPIRDKRDIKKLLDCFLEQGRHRNYVLAVLCIHTALRISDVLNLAWDDVYDLTAKRPKESIVLTEKKTGKAKIVALHKNVREALKIYARKAVPALGMPLILNTRTGKAISRVQAHRILQASGKTAGIKQSVSCHSLRKTFGYHAWRSGTHPAVIMEIYNHSSYSVTRRYLGICQDDKNKAYQGTNYDMAS